VWFGLGLVNGHDFWREIPARKTGSIVHDAMLETRDGAEGLIRARSRWQAADGTVVCTDVTASGSAARTRARFLDFEIALQASHGALTLGDTEEGAMAVRVNEQIRVTHGHKPDLSLGRDTSSTRRAIGTRRRGASAQRGATTLARCATAG
jgi:hypothetical protein